MGKIEKLLNKDWYFQGFNGVPAILFGAAWSMVRDMPKFLGFGYHACIEYFNNDVCYYLYAWEDLYKIRDELFKHIENDKNYLNYLTKTDEKICKRVLRDYERLNKTNWSKVSLDNIFFSWRHASDLYASILAVSHIVEGFTLTTEDRIRALINENFPNNIDALTLLSTPKKHSFMSTEHYELCLIASSIKLAKIDSSNSVIILSNKIINKKISAHQKKYYWKLNSYTSAKFLSVDFFVKEIQEMFIKKVDFEKYIKDYKDLAKRVAAKNKLLKRVKNKELLNLLKISDALFVIHDRRKEYMTRSITYLDIILGEVSKRFKVPLADLYYIRASELEQLPKIWSELKKRRKSSVYISFPEGEAPVLTGQKAKKFFEKIQKNKNSEKVLQIKGNCASPGKVCGVVKVCRGERELVKIKDGDILVACMTQPEFLPAMKKSKAVITDEGGLTCHAAIVSRELGIPCIIGTKNATTILKDGDRVEVDANNGVVTIL